MKTLLICMLTLPLLCNAQAAPYPLVPESEVTPGHLCEEPDRYRHPEQIPYCERRVSTRRKWEIIDHYDQEYGYRIRETGRHHFKIDHFIPLCLGGSNRDENLWPQHREVYEQTDPWEHSLCIKLANGEITQSEAVEKIYEVKLSID